MTIRFTIEIDGQPLDVLAFYTPRQRATETEPAEPGGWRIARVDDPTPDMLNDPDFENQVVSAIEQQAEQQHVAAYSDDAQRRLDEARTA